MSLYNHTNQDLCQLLLCLTNILMQMNDVHTDMFVINHEAQLNCWWFINFQNSHLVPHLSAHNHTFMTKTSKV